MPNSSPITFRPGSPYDAAIEAETARTGRTPSAILRAALAMYFAAKEKKRDKLTTDSLRRGRPPVEKP